MFLIESHAYSRVMPAVATKPRTAAKTSQSSSALLLIAIFKLVKGILLLAVGIGALRFLHRDLAHSVNHWVNVLRVDPDNHYVHSLIARVIRVSPRQLRELSAGTFIYAGLLLTEGVGLMMRKAWAEYFTIITTGLLIPLEVYELYKHITLAKVAVFAINVAIVVYLVMRVRRRAGR